MITSSRRGGVNYLFDNGITPYISYSQSFEPSSFDLWSVPRVSYEPSKGEQYEAGIKYVPKDLPIVVTGAVYQLTKTNNLTADPTNPLAQVPAGEIRARGVELEAKSGAYREYQHDCVLYLYRCGIHEKTPILREIHLSRCQNKWLLCGVITPSMKVRYLA